MAEGDTAPLEIVRGYYAAFTRGGLDALASFYHDDAEAEHPVPRIAGAEVCRGREAIRRVLARFFDRFAGGFENGEHVQVRTLERSENGWIQVEFLQRSDDRDSQERLELAGYSRFLIETGRIRRQRTVAAPIVHSARSDRTVPLSTGGRLYPTRPVVGVGAVIPMGAQVVLVKRRFEPLAGRWSLPGGKLEVGESLTAGVAREVLEETGLEVEVGPLIEVFDRILLDEAGRVQYHYVLIDYLCRPTAGTLQAGSDVSDVALADSADLDSYRLTPKALAVIAQGVELAARQAPPGGPLV